MIGALSFDVLSDGSLVLTVGECCIQAAARRAHGEVTAALLEGRAEAAGLGGVVDVLARFLAATDFSALRTWHPELAGGTRCRVKLYRCDDGTIGWTVVTAT